VLVWLLVVATTVFLHATMMSIFSHDAFVCLLSRASSFGFDLIRFWKFPRGG